jgi:type VI secretion system secreted protein Hcp
VAAVDYFLKIEGIPGESTDSQHKGEIELESFSWGATNSGALGGGGGGGAGKVQIQDFHFVKRLDKASPKLFLAVSTGQHLKSAVVTGRHAGRQGQDFLVYRLSDVQVSSYQIGALSHAAGEPSDQISLNFGRVEIEYRPQKPDGTLDSPITVGWDVEGGKKL